MRIIENRVATVTKENDYYRVPEKVQKYLDNYRSLSIDQEISGYYVGLAGITFEKNLSGVCYVLNGTKDTWFRRIEGLGKGYGLLLRNLKPIKKLKNALGDFDMWLAKVIYVPFECSDSAEWKSLAVESYAYIYVNKAFDVQDVIDYFNENKGNYRP